MTTKVLTIIGARPQFIKAAAVSRALRAHQGIEEIIVHTGQHFDANMSEVFFKQLDIPKPRYNLGFGSLSHGAMTGRMMEGIESHLQLEMPDWVMVYGDTNSTLAGALAAAKMHIPVAHVEAGLRSHNPAMPEEINRVITDRISSLLLCPTETAFKNLRSEGFPFPTSAGSIQYIDVVGDVMVDAVLHYRSKAIREVTLAQWNLADSEYVLCTLHRQENIDHPECLTTILAAFRTIARDIKVVLPIHPRTRKYLETANRTEEMVGLHVIEAVPYLEMQRLEIGASAILTDSGGIQKEAYLHGVPCITLRDETEWVETVDTGWNQLVGADYARIVAAWRNIRKPEDVPRNLFGVGDASGRIVRAITDFSKN
jgi:UDP-GlcNAc3NAcA epimerase